MKLLDWVTSRCTETFQKLNALTKFFFLFGIAALMHAVVLRFIFPGYYSPLWPDHSDPYESVALAFGKVPEPFNLLFWPRPISYLFYFLVGHAGIHGAILLTLMVVFINCTLLAQLVRNVTNIPFNWRFIAFFVLYVFFSHNFFYTFAVWDYCSSVSLLFMLTGTVIYITIRKESATVGYLVLGGTFALAMLAKETYALSAAFLVFLVARNLREAIIGTAAAGIGSIVGLGYSILVAPDPYVNFKAGGIQPYHIVLSPTSIVGLWSRYLSDGYNTVFLMFLLFLVVLIILFALKTRLFEVARAVAFLSLAGLLALIPNSLLPNHYFPGYSWNSAVFLLGSVLLLAHPQLTTSASRIGFAFGAGLLAAMLGTWDLGSKYQVNAGYLELEAIQHKVITALDYFAQQPGIAYGRQRVLVTGIDYMSPFNEGRSLLEWVSNRKLRFDVVDYNLPPVGPPAHLSRGHPAHDFVSFISPKAVNIKNYDRVWMFRFDGSAIGEIRRPSTAAQPSSPFGSAALVLFPALNDIFGNIGFPRARDQLTGYDWLHCGGALLRYNEVEKARDCLVEAARLIPENPYPHFFLGVVEERLGHQAAAIGQVEKAAELDRGAHPKFSQALSQLIAKAQPGR
jgi:tetratricopeptide (TPR) repeat protein